MATPTSCFAVRVGRSTNERACRHAGRTRIFPRHSVRHPHLQTNKSHQPPPPKTPNPPGLREIFYGKRLAGAPHVARYIEHFYRNGSSSSTTATPTFSSASASASTAPAAHDGEEAGDSGGGGGSGGGGDGFASPGLELWIVFRDEGTSLRTLLYSPRQQQQPNSPGKAAAGGGGGGGKGSVLFEPSEIWRQLRTAEGGREVIRGFMRQIVEGAAEVHATGAAHRDLKVGGCCVGVGGGRVLVWVSSTYTHMHAAVQHHPKHGGRAGGGQDRRLQVRHAAVTIHERLPHTTHI